MTCWYASKIMAKTCAPEVFPSASNQSGKEYNSTIFQSRKSSFFGGCPLKSVQASDTVFMFGLTNWRDRTLHGRKICTIFLPWFCLANALWLSWTLRKRQRHGESRAVSGYRNQVDMHHVGIKSRTNESILSSGTCEIVDNAQLRKITFDSHEIT